MLKELQRDFYAFSSYAGNYPDQSKAELSRPEWGETSVKLHKELAGCDESILDFNNDGKLDRVFSKTFMNTYMHGSVLLAQPGRSSTKLLVSASPLDSASLFLPFHLGKVRHSIYDCPPFSQENDEAGFSMKGRNEKDEVYFRGRYSDIAPFSFHGISYIAVSSYSEDTRDFVAVLKPLPDGTFRKIGLLRRISENF